MGTRRRTTRGGWFLIDAIVGFGIIMLLTAVLTVAVTRQQRGSDRLANTREAVQVAEQTLTALQSGAPAPPPPPGAIVQITRANGAETPAGLTWLTVHVTLEGRVATLSGVVPSATAEGAAP